MPWEVSGSCRAAPQSSERRRKAKVWFSKDSERLVHPSRIPRRALPKFPAQVLELPAPEPPSIAAGSPPHTNLATPGVRRKDQ